MNNLIDVTFNTAEADAVLSILDKQARGLPILDADWDSLFASAGYRLLKQREMSIERPFEDHEFKNFINTGELLIWLWYTRAGSSFLVGLDTQTYPF